LPKETLAFQAGNYHDQMKAAIADGEYIDYERLVLTSAYRDLHTRLVEETGNHHLVNIYYDLNIHMQVARAHYLNTVENALQAQKEHEAMIKAIQENDLEGLKCALGEHITHVKTRFLGLLEEHGGTL
jgi:DNA-binding GntR family transcriptional regulator